MLVTAQVLRCTGLGYTEAVSQFIIHDSAIDRNHIKITVTF